MIKVLFALSPNHKLYEFKSDSLVPIENNIMVGISGHQLTITKWRFQNIEVLSTQCTVGPCCTVAILVTGLNSKSALTC